MSKLDRGYVFHEHTADITLECWAPTLEGAFEQAALGAFAVMMDISTVEPLAPVDINVKGFDLQELLVEWVGQIIALIDINSQFYSEFEVLELKEEDGFSLRGENSKAPESFPFPPDMPGAMPFPFMVFPLFWSAAAMLNFLYFH